GAVDVVLDPALPRELADRSNALGTRTETNRRCRSAEVRAAHEPDFRVELIADLQVVRSEAVAIRAVLKPAKITLVVTIQLLRGGSRVVAAEIDVLEEGERGIDAVSLVGRAGRDHGFRSVRKHRADAAPAQDVLLHAQHGEVGGRSPGNVLLAGFDVHHPDAGPPDFPGDTASDIDRNYAVAVQADAAAVEHLRRDRGDTAAAARDARHSAPEVEEASPFEKEIAL